MRLRTALVVSLLVLFSMQAAAAPKRAHAKKWRAAQVLVKYESGFAPETGKHGVKKAKKVFGAFKLKGKARQHADRRGLDRVYLLELDRDNVEEAVAALRRQPGVVYAEPNWIVEFAAVPNDPSYASQWGLAKIGAPEAWDVATSGSAVVVGVVDTGIDLTHPDLVPNLWTNPGEIAGNGADDDGNGFVDDVHGWDFAQNDNDPTDTHGHGTRVAGVIGAAGNNAAGVSGVAWTAKLAALKTGVGDGDVFTTVQAVEYANMMGFRITNNSWGWWLGGMSFLLDDVVEAAEAAGHLFIVAAGNEGKDNDVLPTYPAHYTNSNVITVAATTSSDALASFSNYGATSVDLGAPGESIDSTVRGGGYGSDSGTSFAAPFVAGAAALYWTANPTATHAEVRDAILYSSDPLAALHGRSVSGGRLSLANLFDAESVAPAAVSDLTVTGVTFRSVTFRLTSTGDDGVSGNATRYDLRVSESPLTEANWAEATALSGEPIPQGPGTLETFTLRGLNASKTYYAAVRVLDNAANASPLSNVVTFTTARAAVVFADDAEGGPRDWTIEGSDGNGGPSLWHIDGTATAHFWRYGKRIQFGYDYDTGARNWGTLTSPEIDLTQASDARLRFRQDVWTERVYGFDMARVLVSVDGGPWTPLLEKMFTFYTTLDETIDLSPYDGQRIRLRFSFDTIDAESNDHPGWTLDDVIVDAMSSNAPPVVTASAPSSITEDVAATLTATGSDPEGASLEYKWSFGDGTHAYTQATSVTHAWTLPGPHTVTLVAFDGGNASDPVTLTVSPAPVNDRPVAFIEMGFIDPPYLEETALTISWFGSSDEEGSPLFCRFDYGDGTTQSLPCVGSWPHTWQAPGTYTITLVVNDGELDSLPATQLITIEEATNDRPVARLGGPFAARPNEPVTFDGTASSDEETSIASYLWTFPDGTTSPSATVAKSFASGGHNVSLVVTDQTGLASTAASTQVRVCGGAVANLFPYVEYTCPGGSAKVGVHVSNGFLPMTLTWTDGYTQQVTELFNGYYAERVVTPSAPTSYALASVTDFLDCAGTAGTAPKQIEFAKATLSNNLLRTCPGQSVTIEPALTGSGPWTLVWSDGHLQTIPLNGDRRRTVSPSETTIYTLSSATCASCPAGTTAVVEGSMTVEVMEPLSAVVSGGGTSCNGAGVPVTVTIAGGAPPFTIHWPSGWSVSTSSRTYTTYMTPATATTYTARVSSGSCTVDASGSATVTPWTGAAPRVTNVSGSANICLGQSATITATLSGDGLPFTLTWSDGLVQTVDTLTATRTVSPSTTTVYSVTSIRNAAGCSGSTSGNASVWPSAAPTAVVSGGGYACNGNTARVSVALTGVGPFTITWSDGLTQTVSQSTWRDVAPATATTYTITAISDSRCSGTASGSATVTPSSATMVMVDGGGPSCPNATATIRATITGGHAPYTITWSDGVTQQVTGSVATREVSVTTPTEYRVTAVSPSACGYGLGGGASAYPAAAPSAVVTGGGSFCEGAWTTISASMTGTAPFTVTWSDGVTQTVASTATREVSPGTTTVYTLTSVRDVYCSGPSTGSATATPVKRPVITQHPQNKTIARNTSTTLTVSTTESGLNYQWYQGPTGTTSTPVGTNSATFVTPKLRSTTSYWVKIWKTSCANYPTNSNTATVTVP